MAAALPFVMAAGAVLQGVSGYKSGMYNAGVASENARAADAQGVMEVAGIRREARATDGEAIAAMGANGVALGTGSPLEMLRESAINAEYDVLAARYQSDSQARAYRAEAKAQKSAAKFALVGGALRAGAAAISGGSDLASAGKLAAASGAPRMPTPQLGYDFGGM